MSRHSAGLLLYRRGRPRDGGSGIEVLLCHPGGPLWRRRDDGWWSIPKGEIGAGEDPLAAAEREFVEELGLQVPGGDRRALGDVVQAGGKRVSAWALEGDLDPASIRPGTFELEWPPRSQNRLAVPEVDRAGWFAVAEARRKLLPGQLPLLDRLVGMVGSGAGGARQRTATGGRNRGADAQTVSGATDFK